MKQERKTVEGYSSTKAFHQLAKEKNIRSPLIDQNYKILYENKDPKRAVECLQRYAGFV